MPGLAAPSRWLWQQPPLPHFYCPAVERPAFRTGTWASCQPSPLSPADASAVSRRAALMELGQEDGEGVCVLRVLLRVYVWGPSVCWCLYSRVYVVCTCIHVHIYLYSYVPTGPSLTGCVIYPCFVWMRLLARSQMCVCVCRNV